MTAQEKGPSPDLADAGNGPGGKCDGKHAHNNPPRRRLPPQSNPFADAERLLKHGSERGAMTE